MSLTMQKFNEKEAIPGINRVFNFLNEKRRAYTKIEICKELKEHKANVGVYTVRLKKAKKILCKKISGKWYWAVNTEKKISGSKKAQNYTKTEEKLILQCRSINDRRKLSRKIGRTQEAIRKKRYDLIKRKK